MVVEPINVLFKYNEQVPPVWKIIVTLYHVFELRTGPVIVAVFVPPPDGKLYISILDAFTYKYNEVP